MGYVLKQIVTVTSSRAIPESETPTTPENSEVSVIVRAQESAVNLTALSYTPAFPPGPFEQL